MKFAKENEALDALDVGQSTLIEANTREVMSQLYGLARRPRHVKAGRLFRISSFTMVPSDMTQQIRYAVRFHRVA